MHGEAICRPLGHESPVHGYALCYLGIDGAPVLGMLAQSRSSFPVWWQLMRILRTMLNSSARRHQFSDVVASAYVAAFWETSRSTPLLDLTSRGEHNIMEEQGLEQRQGPPTRCGDRLLLDVWYFVRNSAGSGCRLDSRLGGNIRTRPWRRAPRGAVWSTQRDRVGLCGAQASGNHMFVPLRSPAMASGMFKDGRPRSGICFAHGSGRPPYLGSGLRHTLAMAVRLAVSSFGSEGWDWGHIALRR